MRKGERTASDAANEISPIGRALARLVRLIIHDAPDLADDREVGQGAAE
jgi:hypothetical protein